MKFSACMTAFALALITTVPAIAPAHATTAQFDPQDFEPTSLSGNYLAGRFAGHRRDMDAASWFMQQAYQGDPNNPTLAERAFVLMLSAGQMEEANDLADEVAAVNKRHRMAQIFIGLRHFREGAQKKARKSFAAASFTPVGNLTAALLRAWSYASEGKLTPALKELDKLDGNEAFANFKAFHVALICDFLNNRTRADKAYKIAYEKAGTSLRIVQAYGNYLTRAGKKDLARTIYARFLAQVQENPLISSAHAALDSTDIPAPYIDSAQEGMAEVLFSIASALTDEQSIDVALIYDQFALALRPNFPVANTLLGEIYATTKRYNKSNVAYQKIGLSSPLRPSADIQVASNLDNLEQTDKALAKLAGLIAREPENYNALITQGNILRSKERWAEAADSYTRALARFDKPSAQLWTVYYFRGISFERAGEWQKGEPDFKLALKLKPDQPAVLNYLGYSWIEKRRNLGEAISMVSRAVELRPNDGYIVDSLGWAHYQLRNYAEAVKQLERAVELRPEDTVINDHLGDAYWRIGRKLEAKFQWSHALANKPEDKDRVIIEKKIKDGMADLPTDEPEMVDKDKDKT